MPKVSKTIREWTKGLNTFFSPRDIPDECLAKSPSDGSLTVGIYNDKGGLIRLCGQGYDNWQHSGGSDAPTLDVTCNSCVAHWRNDGRGFHYFTHIYNMKKHALGEHSTTGDYNPTAVDTEFFIGIESGTTHGTYGHIFTDDGSDNTPSRTWATKVLHRTAPQQNL